MQRRAAPPAALALELYISCHATLTPSPHLPEKASPVVPFVTLCRGAGTIVEAASLTPSP